MKLETERLILREPKVSDWKDIVEGINNINISKQLTRVPYPYKEKDAKDFLSKKMKKWKEKDSDDYLFFIELKSEKKVIGCVGLHKIDRFTGIATTGSWINEKYWEKGYISEAKMVVNEFAFNKLKLSKLNSPVFKDNLASNATQKAMGYKLEGTLIKNCRCKATGKIHDENLYGLLKEDWKKNLPKLKKHLKDKIKKLKEEENKK